MLQCYLVSQHLEGSHHVHQPSRWQVSVPMVFVGGVYVGGFDGGTNEEDAPGLVALAFQGRLQSMLEAAGATRK